MKIGKQLIWPLLIILILGIYLGINSTGKMNYKIPVFEVIEGKKINIIRIKGLSGSIKLYSDDEVWRVGDDNLRAEPSKVAEMISFLVDPEFIDMVSDTGNYMNYGLVDGKYINVGAWTNNKGEGDPDRELFIGDINSTGSFAFIRRPDNSSVFTIRGNIKGLFDVSEEDLFDKRVLDIDSKKIDRIELSFTDSSFTLEKSVGDNNEDIWTTSEGIVIESDSLEQSLRYLSNSRFDSYVFADSSNIEENIFQLTLHEETMVHNFTIINRGDDDYSCSSSFAGRDFILSGNTGTQIIKMFKEILTSKDS